MEYDQTVRCLLENFLYQQQRTHAHVSVASVVLKCVRPEIQSNKGHVRRVHGLESEPSVVTFKIRIFDQVLDRLDNLHKIPDHNT